MLNSSTNTLSMTRINVFSVCPNLAYTYDSQILSQNSPILVTPVICPGYPAYPGIPMYPHKTYIKELAFIFTLYSSKSSPAKTLYHPSPFLMLPPATSLDIPPYQNIHHSKSSRPPFSSPTTIATKYPYVGLMKV